LLGFGTVVKNNVTQNGEENKCKIQKNPPLGNQAPPPLQHLKIPV